jgi:hypothetical protein
MREQMLPERCVSHFRDMIGLETVYATIVFSAVCTERSPHLFVMSESGPFRRSSHGKTVDKTGRHRCVVAIRFNLARCTGMHSDRMMT